MSFFQNPDNFWYIFAIIFFIIEVVTVNGVCLFISLAAASTGAALTLGFIAPDSSQAQLIVFLLFTVIWTAALWNPIKTFLRGRKNSDYQDLKGESATVSHQALKKGQKGQVTWSGAVMNAKLIESSGTESIDVGEEVIIKEVQGNTLIVDLKGD